LLEPAIPLNEATRLAALLGMNILDTPPEERFDRLTRLAQRLLDVPIAVVSLVDASRQWFKSCQGLDASETPRSISFCGHAILEDRLFIIPDALLDPRFADNPLVAGPPHIRFYAGQPLKAGDGSRVGTLCVIDSKPRQMTQAERDNLRDMALLVEHELNSLERRETSTALLNSTNRLNAILDNVLDGIITINERGIIESFNKSAEHIFGYVAAGVIGSNVKLLMPEPYHSEHDSYLHNFTATGNKKIIGVGRQVVGRRKDGTIFPMDLAVSEMKMGDKRMFTGIVRDITERVKIERMKSEFISTVSHELRTPLTSIRGSLGLIAGGVAGELPAQAKALVDIAHKNSERLILLVNDILDMEKIEAGKMEFQPRPTGLMPLFRQALEGNRGYAEQFNVTYELAGKLPEVMVHVDANRMLQVLANLLSNAAKFSPAGGKVAVAASSDGKRVRITVSDQGSGIPEQFRGQIFQKFAQADSSDTRKKGGTGLGLSITRAIVEQMGGSIGFDSQPDVLTTFFVEFPVWQKGGGIAPGAMDAGRRKRVLICEDDPDIAALLCLMLEQDGLSADIARDASQAKQMLAQHDYSAMTLDLGLPDQNGISLIRELRAARQTATLPIIVVSANVDHGLKELQGQAFSVIDWIKKPIDRNQLVAALQQAIAQARSTRPRVLHVEDDLDICKVVNAIVGEVADMENATTLAAARRMLNERHYDLVILDVTLPDGSGMELLYDLNSAIPPVPVMLFSASEISAEDIRQVGASLVKSRTDNAQLLATIRRMIGVDS